MSSSSSASSSAPAAVEQRPQIVDRHSVFWVAAMPSAVITSPADPGIVDKYSVFWVCIYPPATGRPRLVTVIHDHYSFLQRDQTRAMPFFIVEKTQNLTNAEDWRCARRAATRTAVNATKYVRVQLLLKPKNSNPQIELEILIKRDEVLGSIIKNIYRIIFRDMSVDDLRFFIKGKIILDSDTATSLAITNNIVEVIIESKINGRNI